MSGRRSPMPLVVLLLPGCWSQWEIRGYVPQSDCAVPRPHYVDADGDGWGGGDSPVRLLPCGGDPDAGYTATNKRDCDDADPDVTGRIGTVCPADLVPGGAAVGRVVGAREYVAVTAPALTVWSGAAEAVCGAGGWGGDLASFDAQAEVDAVYEMLEPLGPWAGFVGLGSDGSAWRWTDGNALPISQIHPCSELPDPAAAEETVRLAMVRRPEGWCLGTPDEIAPPGGTTDPRYDLRHAHFVCARPVPDPDAWSEPAPPAAEPAGG